MNTVLDFGSELLIDRSSTRDPYLRLIADVMGRRLAKGSAWVTVHKADLIRPVALSNGICKTFSEHRPDARKTQFT